MKEINTFMGCFFLPHASFEDAFLKVIFNSYVAVNIVVSCCVLTYGRFHSFGQSASIEASRETHLTNQKSPSSCSHLTHKEPSQPAGL